MDEQSWRCRACGRIVGRQLQTCPRCASEVNSEVAPLQATDPATIGRYSLVGRLGAGGMGVVYLVRDPDGDLYALKALAGSHRMETELRARLAREARSLTALESPHVVRVIDVDTDVEIPYIVMTYAAGTSLERAVPKGGLAPAEVLEYGAQLAGAVDHVHRRGIVHRDVKPQNVIVGPGGVTLVDFGIASLDDEGTTALTRQGTFLGSLGWLAPEIIAGGSADERSDAFGLGLVLGYMALGRNPFGTGRPEAVMYGIMHGEPDLDGCRPELASIIAKALTKDPAGRATTQEILRGLTALSGLKAQLELQALLDAQTRQAEQTRRQLLELQGHQPPSVHQAPGPGPIAPTRVARVASQESGPSAPAQRPFDRWLQYLGFTREHRVAGSSMAQLPPSRVFQYFSSVMAIWGILATAATINTVVLARSGRLSAGTSGELVAMLGIYWQSIAKYSYATSLLVALIVGAVSAMILLVYRAGKAPAWVYGLGLAAGILCLPVDAWLLLGDDRWLGYALPATGFPVTSVDGPLTPTALGWWQVGAFATFLWTAMCAIGMSPVVQGTRGEGGVRVEHSGGSLAPAH